MAYGLTARQMDLLRFIQGYQAASGGVSPTYDEMCDGVGLNHSVRVWRLA